MRTRLEMVTGLVPYLIMGVGSAALGLLPWIMTGMLLPLQNLWAAPTLPEEMPLVLLPFSQYQLTEIAGLIVTGSAIGGGIARATRPRHPRFAVTAVAVGAVGVQLIATVQTAGTVSGGLLNNSAAGLYLAALLCGTIASIMIGLLVLVLISRAPVAGSVVGISIAAIAFAPWLGALFYPLDAVTASPNVVTRGLVDWSPAIIVGVAVAVSGLASIGRVLAAAFSLLMLWVGPALFTAISAAAGTRVLAYQPAEMAKYGVQTLLGALDYRTGSLAPLAVATVIAVLGLAARRTVRRRNLVGIPA